MAKDKLVIDDWSGSGYRLQWWLAEDGDTGGHLGEEEYTEADLKKATSPGTREHIAASLAVAKSPGVRRFDGCYEWESLSAVRTALRSANLVIKAERAAQAIREANAAANKKWPAWAVTAKSYGWKPPKGWKP